MSEAKQFVRQREFLRLAGGAVGGLVLAGCAPAATPETKVVKETVPVTVKETVQVEKVVEKVITPTPPPPAKVPQEIVWLLEEEFGGSLDPHSHFTIGRWQMQFHWGDTLVERDANGKIVPALAESWELVDPTHMKFNLRKGVKFHDGKELTADSVKATFERVVNWDKSAQKAAWVPLKVEVPDKYTAIVATEKPFGVLLADASVTQIVQAENLADPDAVGKKPIGTGPFKVVNFDGANNLVCEAFDDCWRGAPKIRKLTFRYIPDLNTRVASFITGEANVLTNVPLEQLAAVKSRSEVTLTQIPTYQQVYFYIRSNHKPFDDVRVRQALSLAIDRETIRKTIMMDIPELSTGPVASPVFGATKGLPAHEYNPEKAKQLLQEAGAVGAKLFMFVLVGSFPKAEQIGEAVADALGKVGFQVTYKAVEHGLGTKMLNEDQGDLIYSGCANIQGEAFNCSKLYSYDFNKLRGAYNNPKVTELFAQAKQEPDDTKRQAIYDEMNKIAWDEVAMINLFDTKMNVATRKNVQSFHAMSSLMHRVGIDTYIG